MTDQKFRFIVEEVIRRLAGRASEAMHDEFLIAVFTGATVAFVEAVRQMRLLLLDGFRIQMLFSRSAEHLLADEVKRQLGDLSGLGTLSTEKWFSSLKNARGVVVPMLSLNAASKLSLLIADDPVGNILLHALLMGKPLIMAEDGVDPDSEGRRALGLHKGNEALKDAIRQRLQTLRRFGCVLTCAGRLAASVRTALEAEGLESKDERCSTPESIGLCGQVATAGDVLAAHQRAANLDLGPGAIVTPLARDLAGRLGVGLIRADKPRF